MSQATRDLILVLADTKRLLGMRYAEWILGAPALEAGIACASMAQDEWGHGRLLYALLKDFGDDVDRLEHGREASEYCNLELLDEPVGSWPDLVVINALADTAVTTLLDAMRESSYAPLRQRVGKIVDEEQFHAAHGAAWLKRIASAAPEAQQMLHASVERALPVILRWFGPDSDRANELLNNGVVNANGTELRARFLEQVGPLLAAADGSGALRDLQPSFDGFDERTRRAHNGGPDAATIGR
ncbi:MAG TPA: Phenylacetic acid catabolic protein, partial [Steroidobacteraceae bacterium]